MRFIIFTSEPFKDAHLLALEEDYLKRMRGWAPVVLMTKESRERHKGPRGFLPASVRESFVVLLDEQGEKLSSTGFSGLLDQSMKQGGRDTVFCIGPAQGWRPEERGEADRLISLSSMTFPHQLVRLLLVEQLYRGLSILRGHPYHKK